MPGLGKQDLEVSQCGEVRVKHKDLAQRSQQSPITDNDSETFCSATSELRRQEDAAAFAYRKM